MTTLRIQGNTTDLAMPAFNLQTDPEVTRRAMNNLTLLSALAIDYAYDQGLTLVGTLKQQRLWKTHNAYKQAALRVRDEHKRINKIFCGLGGAIAVDYVDQATEALGAKLKPLTTTYYWADKNYYLKAGAEYADLLAQLDMHGLVVANLLLLCDKVEEYANKVISGRTQSRLSLRRYGDALGDLCETIPGFVTATIRKQDKNIERGITAIANAILLTSENLLHCYDDCDLLQT